MINVTITEDYRLTSDGTQFILQVRKMVDPTKAPNWTKRFAEGADPTPYETWENDGFYSLNERGLTTAITAVIYRTVAVSDAENLREFSRSIRELGESIRAEIEALIPRPDYARVSGEEESASE